MVGQATLPLEEALEALQLDAEEHPDVALDALLLPLRSGAAFGVNLVAAQHVLLAEPLLNASLEAQAIGRVHRISQERETTVHRFVVSATVEQAIHDFRVGEHKEGQAEGTQRKAGSGADELCALSWTQLQSLFQIPSTSTLS